MKQLLKRTFLYFHGIKSKYVEKFVIPPYAEKRAIINHYKDKYSLNTLVETGTFLGDTVEYFKNKFNKIYSIELSKELADRAVARFKNDSNVTILQGDSGEVLKDILARIDTTVMFWLDGHYSSEFFLNGEYIKTAKGEKETPVEKELDLILSKKEDHVILIDDARLFTGRADYPHMNAIRKKVAQFKPNYEVKVKRDIIRITPA